MKKLFLILIPFLFIGCTSYVETYHIVNSCDWDVEIEYDGNIFISKSNTEMYHDGNSFKDYVLKTSKPVKMNRYDRTVTIVNNYKTSKLNVKNKTSDKISFKIENNPDNTDFIINENSEKSFDLKTDSPKISDSSCKYYSMNQDNGEYFLIFIN